MAKRFFLRIGDFIFVTRPLILIPAWSFYLLGVRGARADGAAEGGSALTGLVCLSAILVAAYLLNQVFDRESDRINGKGHFLTRGIVSVRTVIVMAFLFLSLASLAFRSVPGAQRLPLAGALVLSLVYSLPPIRLCARPVFDLAANAVGYGGLAFVAGYAARSDGVTGALMRALPWVLMVGGTFLHTTILDVEGDRRSAKISTTVRIGVGWSALLAVLLVSAGTGWAWAVSWRGRGDLLAPVALSLCLIVFFYAYLRIRPLSAHPNGHAASLHATSSNAVQLATLIVTFPAALYAPLYAVVLVPLLIASRAYYRLRFGLSYPGPAESAPNA